MPHPPLLDREQGLRQLFIPLGARVLGWLVWFCCESSSQEISLGLTAVLVSPCAVGRANVATVEAKSNKCFTELWHGAQCLRQRACEAKGLV